MRFEKGTAMKKSSIFQKLSYFIWGLNNIVCGQVIKGIIFLAIEIAYIFYMVTSGVTNLINLVTLGTQEQGMVFDESVGIYVIAQGDNSMLFLLYGVATLVVSIVVFAIGYMSVKSGKEVRVLKESAKHIPGFFEELRSLLDKKIYRLFLAIPVVGILVFTVTPLIYMILMAFTNYDANHQPPGNLFGWVGLKTFSDIMSANNNISATFWPVLGWTLLWGFVATFSCYFLGMFLAILINSEGIRFKKIWRTVFMLTMAIPAFISLLVVSTMLGENGIVNVLLQQWGFSAKALPFLTNGTWAKCTVIVVNLWIGIPSTMLMVTGILMNIPKELYESARIDGAGPVMMFIKVTFPYMLFITTPYLITNLIGNFNNFGVIYFLTGGGPSTLDYYKGAGKTDLLVTWLYKLTKDSNDFNYAAALGIIIFVISAVISLVTYSRSNAIKDEEGFQ